MNNSGAPIATTSINLAKWWIERFPKERCSIYFSERSVEIPSWTKRQSEAFVKIVIKNTSDFDIKDIEIRSNRKDLRIVEQNGNFSVDTDNNQSILKLPLLKVSEEINLVAHSNGWGGLNVQLFRAGRKHANQYTFGETVARWFEKFDEMMPSVTLMLAFVLFTSLLIGLAFWFSNRQVNNALEENHKLVTQAAKRAGSDFLRVKDQDERSYAVHGIGCGNKLTFEKLNDLDESRYEPIDGKYVVCDTRFSKPVKN